MGTNIEGRLVKSWMRRNFWEYEETNKHEVWLLIVNDPTTGDRLVSDRWVGGFHQKKGQGFPDSFLKQISNKMRVNKMTLVKMIREKKDINIKKYISCLKEGIVYE